MLLRKLKLFSWDGTNETVPEYLEPGETLRDDGGNAVTVHTNGPLPAGGLLPVPMGVTAVTDG